MWNIKKSQRSEHGKSPSPINILTMDVLAMRMKFWRLWAYAHIHILICIYTQRPRDRRCWWHFGVVYLKASYDALHETGQKQFIFLVVVFRFRLYTSTLSCVRAKAFIKLLKYPHSNSQTKNAYVIWMGRCVCVREREREKSASILYLYYQLFLFFSPLYVSYLFFFYFFAFLAIMCIVRYTCSFLSVCYCANMPQHWLIVEMCAHIQEAQQIDKQATKWEANKWTRAVESECARKKECEWDKTRRWAATFHNTLARDYLTAWECHSEHTQKSTPRTTQRT